MARLPVLDRRARRRRHVVRIVFVCLGNICRSPTAEGVMRHAAARAGVDVTLDSAGTGNWHVGEPPDPRTIRAAKQRGYALDDLRGRQFGIQDFHDFDLIVAMDRSNLDAITRLAKQCPGPVPPIRMLRSFDPTSDPDADVPDPYSGGARGFEEVLEICERACAGLLDHVRAQRASVGS
ncbi:MAG: low molecular weight protein-tyrosine-phosphatase [Kofleriaceae bacterium]